jgi:hypothetical protein
LIIFGFMTGSEYMARPKFDGVVESVHYQEDGQVAWVRAFLRRGPTWSDRILLDRQTLLEQMKAGKRFVAGKRVPLLAGTFETSESLKIQKTDGQEVIVVGDNQAGRDDLDGVPIL